MYASCAAVEEMLKMEEKHVQRLFWPSVLSWFFAYWTECTEIGSGLSTERKKVECEWDRSGSNADLGHIRFRSTITCKFTKH